ncbi:MAG: hypothetical protein KGD63_15055 [Candidatus Lokiarchaeota archaeon]|nr:hypothetical protein [Candidatus Lokiarchaeota archaeon]
MKQTIKFRLHPSTSQEQKSYEILTIYNKVKQMCFKKLLKLKDMDLKKNEKRSKFWNFTEITNVL